MARNVQLPFLGRVIYAFQPQLEGELRLNVGELVLAIRADDRYWFFGQIATEYGRFPSSHVTALQLPNASAGHKYFCSVGAFSEQQAGDLSFGKGEIIVGMSAIDTNWWFGHTSDGREGIFPTSLVWPVDLPPTQNRSGSRQFVKKRARIIQDLVAQLPEELNLRKGGELIVTGEAEDEGWYRGEFEGKVGIFPAGFVTLLSDVLEEEISAPTGTTQVPSVSSASLSEKVTDSVSSSNGHSQLSDKNVNFLPADNRPYGIASYDYQSQYSDELSLREGQLVYLLKHINDEWMQGEDAQSSQIGIFPTAFIEIIVDCPSQSGDVAYNQSAQSSEMSSVDMFDPLKFTEWTGSSNLYSHVQTSSSQDSHVNLLPTLDFCSWMKPVSLDSVIEKNLNELVHTRPSEAPAKRKVVSSPAWTCVQTPPHVPVDAVQTYLPPLPPRAVETPKEKCLPTEMRTRVEQTDPIVTRCHTDGDANDDKSQHLYYNQPDLVSESADGLDERRASYTRPAPPPPINEPNAGMSRQNSTSSLVTARIAPMRPAPFVPGSDDRVEGRRQRAEKEKQRKMEEEQLRNVEIRKKLNEQRDNVVTELVVTEREFCRDLRMTCQVFHIGESNYLERKGIDGATLFGNVMEVMRLSERLIDMLVPASEDPSQNVSIGSAFIQLEPEFRRIYGHYCTNHDDAQSLLEKYESTPSTNQFLDQGVQTLRERIICFNMGSVIIKPVQRILKYPLILSELIKYTEEGHADKSNLIVASSLMTNVASFINESKRKKEIVLKYRDSGLEEKLSRKISRLNLHSVAKKSSRLGMLLKTSLGIAPMNRDTAFDEVEARFNELVRVLQTSLRDITTVCEHFKTTSQIQFNISETVASFYGERSRVPIIDNFRTAQRMIFTQHWTAFDSYVIQHVRNPLTALCEACQGPERLVQKRRDKLLDYNIASERLAKNKDASLKRTLEEEQNLARNTYMALNSQLMEELPVVTEHGYKIFRRCLSSFLYARKLFVGRTTKELLDLAEIPEIAALQGDIVEDFNQAHTRVVERLSSVSFISKVFRSFVAAGGEGNSPKSSASRKSSSEKGNNLASTNEGLVVQTREVINKLRTAYNPDQLHLVSGRCDIKEVLDLAANTGLIVAVIKKEDPMGNTGRWFVDAGDIRGFLPAKHLVPAGQTRSSRLLRPDSIISETSSGGNSTESFQEAMMSGESSQSADGTNGHASHFYDLPPSYEEAQALNSTHKLDNQSSVRGDEVTDPSTHRYCEIDDILKENSLTDEGTSATGASTYNPIEKTANMTYQEIQDPKRSPRTLASRDVYKAEYAFQQRSPLEIDLGEGEFVTVLAKQDVAGNTDWWLVQNDAGAQGYVPASYLSQLIVQDTPHLFI